jgi:hypothetical protein
MAPVLGYPVADGSPALTEPSERPLSSADRFRVLFHIAEAAVLVVGVYVLIGAGIGEVAGSLLVGVAAGLIAGVCAIGAILLIRGSALSAGRGSDPAAGQQAVETTYLR